MADTNVQAWRLGSWDPFIFSYLSCAGASQNPILPYGQESVEPLDAVNSAWVSKRLPGRFRIPARKVWSCAHSGLLGSISKIIFSQILVLISKGMSITANVPMRELYPETIT
jgi:hypothetical protein